MINAYDQASGLVATAPGERGVPLDKALTTLKPAEDGITQTFVRFCFRWEGHAKAVFVGGIFDQFTYSFMLTKITKKDDSNAEYFAADDADTSILEKVLGQYQKHCEPDPNAKEPFHFDHPWRPYLTANGEAACQQSSMIFRKEVSNLYGDSIPRHERLLSFAAQREANIFLSYGADNQRRYEAETRHFIESRKLSIGWQVNGSAVIGHLDVPEAQNPDESQVHFTDGTIVDITWDAPKLTGLKREKFTVMVTDSLYGITLKSKLLVVVLEGARGKTMVKEYGVHAPARFKDVWR